MNHGKPKEVLRKPNRPLTFFDPNPNVSALTQRFEACCVADKNNPMNLPEEKCATRVRKKRRLNANEISLSPHDTLLSVLMKAITNGEVQKVSEIIEHNPMLINAKDSAGNTPIMHLLSEHSETRSHAMIFDILWKHPHVNLLTNNHQNEDAEILAEKREQQWPDVNTKRINSDHDNPGDSFREKIMQLLVWNMNHEFEQMYIKSSHESPQCKK